ncbi:MAG TPA: type I methionyl aminopeptidase [Patescibacteria group bacterium]
MIVKDANQKNLMKRSSQIAAGALKEVVKYVRAGITTKELDGIAHAQITKAGATPSFQTVDNYKYTICTTVNDEVVHGLPTDYKLQEGDVLGIDIGALYKGYHSDCAVSVIVGKSDDRKEKFLMTGKEALNKAISKARVGNKVGDISAEIQRIIEGAGYSPVKALTGHGVGQELHEDPIIPCFGRAGTGPKIREGMALAIEAIYGENTGEITYKNGDGWTIATKDGSLGGLFEKTVLVQKSGPIVLTNWE